MIRVDRARVTAPRTLKSKAALGALARAERFKHLVFIEDGIVTWQRPGKPPSKKGEASIQVYALLRDGLVRARAAHEKNLKVQMQITEDIVLGLADDPDSVPLNRALDTQLALLESFTKPEAPYSEMSRQLLEPFLRKFVS